MCICTSKYIREFRLAEKPFAVTAQSECCGLNFCSYKSVRMACDHMVKFKNRSDTAQMIALALYCIASYKEICVTDSQMRAEAQTTFVTL